MRCPLTLKIVAYIICAFICGIILGYLYDFIINYPENYWQHHYLTGSLFIGISCSVIISILSWFMHDLYFALRLRKYGHLVNALITSKTITQTQSHTNYGTGGPGGGPDPNTLQLPATHPKNQSYHITYSFEKSQNDISISKTQMIVYNYCRKYLSDDIMDLCIDYVGNDDDEFEVQQTITESEYNHFPDIGGYMKIKYDPKYPDTNRIIPDVEGKYLLRDCCCFMLTLVAFGMVIWALFEFYLVDLEHAGLGMEEILTSIGVILGCFIVITCPFVICVCRCNKSMCFSDRDN